jgi:hypothetical protein
MEGLMLFFWKVRCQDFYLTLTVVFSSSSKTTARFNQLMGKTDQLVGRSKYKGIAGLGVLYAEQI